MGPAEDSLTASQRGGPPPAVSRERTHGCVPGRGTDLHTATAGGAATTRARLTAITVPALLIASALLIAVGPLSAQQQRAPAVVDTTPLPEAGRSDGGVPAGVVSTGDFVRMVVVLAAVLGAIYLLFRFIRRAAAAGRRGNGALIAVLGSRSLGGNRSLHLIRAGRGFYLVGAADQAVNLVAEITDPDSLELLAAQPAGSGAAPRNRFADLLAEAGIGTAGGARPAAPGDAAFLRRQRDRVRRLGGGPAREEDARATP